MKVILILNVKNDTAFSEIAQQLEKANKLGDIHITDILLTGNVMPKQFQTVTTLSKSKIYAEFQFILKEPTFATDVVLQFSEDATVNEITLMNRMIESIKHSKLIKNCKDLSEL